MIYNKIVQAYFFHPLHVGLLDNNNPRTAFCSVEQKEQNTRVAFFCSWDEQGVIDKAVYKAVGSPFVIASMEWLCRAIEGKAIADLPKINHHELVQTLKIPALQYPTAVLVESLYHEMVLLVNSKWESK